VAILAGDEQRRRAVFLRLVDLRVVVQQQTHYIGVPPSAGDEQRRLTFFICPVDLCTFLQQQSHRVDLAVTAGGVQWRFSVTVHSRTVNLRAFI